MEQVDAMAVSESVDQGAYLHTWVCIYVPLSMYIKESVDEGPS